MVLVKKKLCGAALLAAAMLTACNSSNNDGDDSGGRPGATTHGLSGSVAGLDGSVVLKWASKQTTLTANGAFNVDDAVTSGDNVTLSLSGVPAGQECSITTQKVFNDVQADISGVGIRCNDLTELRVDVRNYFNGTAIENAAVRLVWDDDGVPMQRSVTTGADGSVELLVSPFSGRLSITADFAEYGEQSVIVTSDGSSQPLRSSVLLLPANETITFSADTGGALTVDGVEVVSIPGAAFVSADGTAYSGEVTAEITLIDPSSDPGIMPGDFTTLDEATGVVAQIESFGAVNITFESAAGEMLDLASGEVATIRIPVALGASSRPDTIPLFYYDDGLGRWIEEGSAALGTSGGVAVYEGTVSHFTTWNADYLYEAIQIEGCVVDTEGNSVPGTVIQSRGSSYIGTASRVADSEGNFTVPARPSSRVFLSARNGDQSRTVTINTTTENTLIESCLVVDEAASTITLSWGENPRDLDTHFTGPADAEGDTTFHIDYTNKSVDVGGTNLYLDVDDTSSFGPEIVSIPTFPFAGTYRYGVYLYSGSGDIQSSPARVELNLNGDLSIFSPPEGTPTTCWAVFDLQVAEGGVTTVLPLNSWDETGASCQSSYRPDAAERSTAVTSPFQNAIKSKHYAK